LSARAEFPSDLRSPGVDLLPVPKVPVWHAQAAHDDSFGEGEPVSIYPAGKDTMVTRAGHSG
jgi:hypothetical protein